MGTVYTNNGVCFIYRAGTDDQHKSEGFLKSLWNNITHHHHDQSTDADGAAKGPGTDSKPNSSKSDDKNKAP